MDNTRIYMVRPHLEHIPEWPLPGGYAIRTYIPGDEGAWKRIHIRADRFNTFTDGTFREQFGGDPSLLAENQLYLLNEKETPVGTATAWHINRGETSGEEGRVHWIAIDPTEQGRGLSRPLLGAVCRRLKDRGFTSAYLSTSTARPPAVRLYLSFGFVPEIRGASQRNAWLKLRNRLGPRGHQVGIC